MSKKQPTPVAKRGRGRPRHTPTGSRERKWLATDAEYERLRAEADGLGITVPELVRRRVIGTSAAV